MEEWFSEKNYILNESNYIIFFFSIDDWLNTRSKIFELLEKLSNYQILNNIDSNKILIFCHKIDLITEKFDVLKNEITQLIKPFNFTLTFTSIKDGCNKELNFVLESIIHKNSEMIEYLLKKIENWNYEYQIEPIFIMDKYCKLIRELNTDEIDKFEYENIIDICSSLQIKINSIKKIPQYFMFSTENSEINYIAIIFYPNFKELGLICCKIKDLSSIHSILIFINNLRKNNF